MPVPVDRLTESALHTRDVIFVLPRLVCLTAVRAEPSSVMLDVALRLLLIPIPLDHRLAATTAAVARSGAATLLNEKAWYRNARDGSETEGGVLVAATNDACLNHIVGGGTKVLRQASARGERPGGTLSDDRATLTEFDGGPDREAG